MKKQLYPDLTRLRIVKYASHDVPMDVIVLFKNGGQYSICHVEGKDVFHATEARLTEMVDRGFKYTSPLYKALE